MTFQDENFQFRFAEFKVSSIKRFLMSAQCGQTRYEFIPCEIVTVIRIKMQILKGFELLCLLWETKVGEKLLL